MGHPSDGSGWVRRPRVCRREIPRPAGENAGLRDDAGFGVGRRGFGLRVCVCVVVPERLRLLLVVEPREDARGDGNPHFSRKGRARNGAPTVFLIAAKSKAWPTALSDFGE
jgi:hypothetical protein